MITSFDSVATLSEQELLDHFNGLVARDRRTIAALLVAIAEIDERKIWAKHACSSMFTFCMERFHMSEQVTAKRLWAARTARRFPVILRMVERGELHLGAIRLLATHLTEANHVQVLERAKHRSSREVERLVAELALRADVPSRIRALPEPRAAGAKADRPATAESADDTSGLTHDVFPDPDQVTDESVGRSCNERTPARAESRTAKPIVPLSPRRYKIEITVDEATHDRLRSLQDLLARSETGRDPAAIISRAIEVLLVRTLARKAGCTGRPRSTTPTDAASRRRRRCRTAPVAIGTAKQHRSHRRRRHFAARPWKWSRSAGRWRGSPDTTSTPNHPGRRTTRSVATRLRALLLHGCARPSLP